MKYLFYYIVFPGFIFTAFGAVIASWIERKLTARLQWRVGPRLLQPLYDILKLFGKEIVIPKGAKSTGFLVSPLVGFSGIILVSTILWVVNLGYEKLFIGDLIVVIYLLILPSISLISGGLASANPLAAIGASREIKLLLSYELPFIISIFTVIVKIKSIMLYNIIEFQSLHGIMLSSLSGIIAFIVAILCVQAKVGFPPFDVAEAETELICGNLTEYSGAPLGFFKLTKIMMLFVLPLFLITIFWGGVNFEGIRNSILSFLKYITILVVIVLIKNTNPRLRIDTAMKFFWGPVTFLAIVGMILAFLGR